MTISLYPSTRLSERDTFIRLLADRSLTQYLISDKIKIGTPVAIENNYIEDTYFKKPTFNSVIEASKLISGKNTGGPDITNTRIKIGGGDYFIEEEISYYRRDLEALRKISQDIKGNYHLYNIAGKKDEDHIVEIANKLSFHKDSVNFNFVKERVENTDLIKRIEITAKPDSLLYKGSTTIYPVKTFTTKVEYKGEPMVNPRFCPNIKFVGLVNHVFNQFNITQYDDTKQMLTGLYSWNSGNSERITPYNRTGTNGAVVSSKSQLASTYHFLEKYFPRGITHYTQYIAIPHDPELRIIPGNFLATGCFKDFIDKWNRHYGGVYTRNQIRAINAAEEVGIYNYLGNIIAFSPYNEYITDGAFTACNPKVLIVPPNLSVGGTTADFFLSNVKTIYYDVKSRPMILYLQFNTTSGGMGATNDKQATDFFTSKGITIKPIRLSID